jgi:superfamily II DNA helicase RecQ
VVYSNLVLKIKALAKKLGCNVYYYNAIGKASILAGFIANKQQVIIVTSALGIGVNIPNI